MVVVIVGRNLVVVDHGVLVVLRVVLVQFSGHAFQGVDDALMVIGQVVPLQCIRYVLLLDWNVRRVINYRRTRY